jgi:adenylate cyclase
LSHAVSQAGGTLDKYIGDNVMAFYGAPIPQADHAIRACRSALRQLEAIQALRPKWEQGDWPVIGLRIGMNTGDMIVGSIGGENGQDYTVIGDAVNLASRLEAVNKVYGTKALCTESTWRAAKDTIAMREIDQIRVAGKQQPVRIFEIVAEASELADTKRQVIATYERGLAAYRARNWSDAAAAFDEALALDAADGPSKVMADRLRKVNADPPGEGWDGVWTLKEK